MKALSQPLFASLHGYDRAQLGPDLFSGALIALLSIPISMGYAQLAGLPPVYGLYAHILRAVEKVCVVKCVFHAAPLFPRPGRTGQNE